MITDIKKKILTILVMALTPFSIASAASTDAADFKSLFQRVGTNQNLNDELRRQSVLELLGSTGKNCVDQNNQAIQCEWPDFPRIWFEKIEGKNTNTKIAVTADMSIQIPGIFEAKEGIEITPYNYTYSTEISLQVIGTRQVKTAGAPNISPSAAQGDELEDLFIPNFDNHAKPQRYFRVSPTSPMIGFCTYRMGIRKEFTTNAYGSVKVSFPGGLFGASGGVLGSQSDTKYEQEGVLLQSQFFQIRGDVPVDDYLGVKCKQQFLPTARAFVQRSFDIIVLTTLGKWPLGSQCQMETEKTEAGDDDCMQWFMTTQHPTTQFISRPRCDNSNKKHIPKCELRIKEGMPCQMYVDRNGGFTDKYRLYSEATTAIISSPCDQGLKCSMDTNPWMIGTMVLWPGRATCKPIN